MLRIAFLGPFAPYRGGIAHFNDAMIKNMSARGHSVKVFNFRRLYPSPLFPGRSQLEPGIGVGQAVDNRVLDSLNPLAWISTARSIAKQKPNAVVMPYWEPFFAPALGTIARCLRGSGSRIFAIVHNAAPHERRPGSTLLRNYMFRSVDGLIALSGKVEEELKKDASLSCSVSRLFHPVYEHFGSAISQSEARSRVGVRPEVPVILFFGLVRKYKGLEVIIRAMRSVVNALPEALLIVAGEFYESKKRYIKLIKELGLEQNVRLDDFYVDERHVAAYFCAADLVVLPYLSGSQSGVQSAAYHFEKPVIMSNLSGLLGGAGVDSSFVVPPGDSDTLAAAVIRFFADPDANSHLKSIIDYKRSHSWSVFCESLERLLSK